MNILNLCNKSFFTSHLKKVKDQYLKQDVKVFLKN